MRIALTSNGYLSPELIAYYRSPGWKARAKRIKSRDGWRCRACRINPYRNKKRWWQFWRRRNWLTVYHLTYADWQHLPGSEKDEDLVTLCRFCHSEVTDRFRRGQFGGYAEPYRPITAMVIARENAKADKRDARDRRKAERASRRFRDHLARDVQHRPRSPGRSVQPTRRRVS